jgi:hypothetical protein
MISLEQLQHAANEHKGGKANRWHLLSGEEETDARLVGQLVQEKIKSQNWLVDPPHDEVVWSCAHCRDLPDEQKITGIDEVKMHIADEYVVSLFYLVYEC